MSKVCVFEVYELAVRKLEILRFSAYKPGGL